MLRADETACTHCGLPVPASRIEPSRTEQFCCDGCHTVFDVLSDHGLDRFYDVARSAGAVPPRAAPSGRRFEEFDDPAFERLYVRSRRDGSRTADLYLEGVHCAACVWLVERAPIAVPGAVEARLDIGRSLARVVWDPSETSLSAIARFFDSVGYRPHPYRGVRVREMRLREDRALLVRIAVAGASAGNVMLIAFALYGGALHGMESEYETFLRWTSLVVALPAVLFSAAVFFRGAWGALRTGMLHMDVPVALGIAAGFGWGAANTVLGRGEIYFDTITGLVFLLLVGRWLQRRRQRRFAESAELLLHLAPSSARLLEPDGGVREVPLEALAPGARVEVPPGEAVPVDGTVVDGSSSVDLSLLTGESRPSGVGPGDRVHAGTTNLDTALVVRVERSGEDTRLGRLMRLVEEGARNKPPVVLLADRLSGWFVAAVLVLAATTALLWWAVSPERAVENAIALLIVTCPCALGLATPLAVAAAVGRAARARILVHRSEALERLGRDPGRILLDKTGTLTEGTLTVARWWGDADARAWAASVEAGIPHPVARAIAADRTTTGSGLVARGVRRHPRGVEGRVSDRAIRVGSPDWVLEAAKPPAGEVRREIARAAAEGLTPVLVSVGGSVVAGAALGDRIRPEAAATVDRLRSAGWTIEILSGDHPDVVSGVARLLEIPAGLARGGVTPEGKLKRVREAGDRTVVMVGDGVNDAAALAAAGVGVAVRGGAEAAMAAADVFLARPGIGALAELVAGSRRTLRVIRRNLVFSLVYNLVGAGLAMAGLLEPLVAAILMPLSSLTVITSSFRARTFDPCP